MLVDGTKAGIAERTPGNGVRCDVFGGTTRSMEIGYRVDGKTSCLILGHL